MSDWTAADLDRIGSATELEITTRRTDGSLRPYVPVWVVRVGGELFVRSWRGQATTWYRHARQRPDGRVRAGGAERDVTFERPRTARPWISTGPTGPSKAGTATPTSGL